MTLLSVLVNASRYSYPLSPLFVPRYRSLPNFSKSPPPCLNLHKQKSSPIPASVWVRPPIHHKDQTPQAHAYPDRKSTRLNSSHVAISYAVFCLKKKKSDK